MRNLKLTLLIFNKIEVVLRNFGMKRGPLKYLTLLSTFSSNVVQLGNSSLRAVG